MENISKPAHCNGTLLEHGLVIVHSTDYKPEINPDGTVSITPRHLLPDSPIPRNTTHFTLNHMVSDHAGGQWADKKYAIIAPFNAMLDKNGAPAGFNTGDTFWSSGKGEKLVIPNATVIENNGIISLAQSVKQKIEEMGYRHIQGGAHGWNETVPGMDEYVKKIGTRHMQHASGAYGTAEYKAAGILSDIIGLEGLEKYQKSGQKPTFIDSVYNEHGHLLRQAEYQIHTDKGFRSYEPERFHDLIKGNSLRKDIRLLREKLKHTDLKTEALYEEWLQLLAPRIGNAMRCGAKEVNRVMHVVNPAAKSLTHGW